MKTFTKAYAVSAMLLCLSSCSKKPESVVIAEPIESPQNTISTMPTVPMPEPDIIKETLPVMRKNRLPELPPIPFEDIAYFSKIRWIGFYSVLPRYIEFSFGQTDAQEYVKLFRFNTPKTESYFMTLESYFAVYINDNEKYREPTRYNTGYSQTEGGLTNLLERTRAEGKIAEIRRGTIENNFFLSVNFIFSDGRWLDENGSHMLTYSEDENAFVSKPDYGQIKGAKIEDGQIEVTKVYNDDFKFVIKQVTPVAELLVLETKKYTMPVMPIEVCFVKDAPLSIRNVKLRANPDMDSEIIDSFSKEEIVTVSESQNEWVEIDGVLSVWIKIKRENGAEGWIWGGEIKDISFMGYLSEYIDDYLESLGYSRWPS